MTGLNTRFDRMVNRVNLTLEETHTLPRRGRDRASSAGSSSASSGYDVPKTPVDAYNGLEEGRLGKSFAIIKMPSESGHSGYYRAGEASDENDDDGASPKNSRRV